MTAAKDTWTGSERREFCTLCQVRIDEKIKGACAKARIAMWLSGILVAICFAATGISYSAKADVANQKEAMVKQERILTEILKDQKVISHDLNQIAEFVNLLKAGKIVVHEHARNGRDHEEDNRSN